MFNLQMSKLNPMAKSFKKITKKCTAANYYFDVENWMSRKHKDIQAVSILLWFNKLKLYFKNSVKFMSYLCESVYSQGGEHERF